MKKSEKLNIDDLSILSVGEQIKNEILETGRTIEEFSKEIDLYPVSVKQYLRRDDGGSATFKIKLMRNLNKSFDEIVKEPAEQLSEINKKISKNIHLYSTVEDGVVLQHIETLVKKHNIHSQIPWVQRNNAMHKFYRNLVSDAIELMELAIDEVKKIKDSCGVMLFSADIGLMYYYRFEYDKARIYLEKSLEKMESIKNVTPKTKFLVYFRNGIVFSHLNQYEHAKKFFNLALDFATEQTFEGLALMQLGIAQFKSGNFDEAQSVFELALDKFEGDTVRQSVVYNYFAELHMDLNDYEKAMTYIEKAMEYNENEDVLNSFQCYEIYARIQMKLGRDDIVTKKLLSLIDQASYEFVYRNKIIGALNLLLEYINETSAHLIIDVENTILWLIERARDDNTEYKKELKYLLGEFTLKTKYMNKELG